MGSTEYYGQWWLPEKPENKVSGKLNFECGKSPTLSLDGIFGNVYETNFYDIILGDSLGVEITLVSCFPSGASILRRNFREYKKSEYHVSFLCTGFHFAKRQEITFRKISAKYSHLRDWLGPSIFSFSDHKDVDQEHIVRIKKPSGKEVVLDGIKLRMGGSVDQSYGLYHDSSIRSASVQIEATGEMHLDSLFLILFHIRNFISLATGERVSVLTLTGEKTDPKPYGGIEIFSRQTLGEKGSEDRFAFNPVPIAYKEVSEQLSSYIENWFKMIRRIEPAYQLFFGNLYRNEYPVNEFLGYVQAIEAYHCRTFENTIIDPSLFAKSKAHFLRIVDEFLMEYASDFKTKIEYMNTRSLRSRLRELLNKYSYLSEMIAENPESFIGQVVDTRNYYTHYDPKSEAKVTDTDRIFFLKDSLRLLLTAIFLDEIGFNEAQIKRTVQIYSIHRTKAIYR
jgi:hypothetical protein